MKLVRDFIPHLIEENGKLSNWRKVCDHDEHMQRLKLKIIEEADEFIENPCLEEAADMLEVVKAYADINGFKFDDVLATAEDKARERGGFTQGVVLIEVYNESR
jgi:predicted house-cleaning noncanonical NTP pyrophosphatase (MazG superfamily)